MSKNIIIIDDSPTLRKVVKFYLEKKGYSVKEAKNGKEALVQIEKEYFDLIILDMLMPVMNGYQVLEELKKKGDFNSPILILSADKESDSKDKSIDLGASFYLTKPFKPNELVDQIEKIFESLDG